MVNELIFFRTYSLANFFKTNICRISMSTIYLHTSLCPQFSFVRTFWSLVFVNNPLKHAFNSTFLRLSSGTILNSFNGRSVSVYFSTHLFELLVDLSFIIGVSFRKYLVINIQRQLRFHQNGVLFNYYFIKCI